MELQDVNCKNHYKEFINTYAERIINDHINNMDEGEIKELLFLQFSHDEIKNALKNRESLNFDCSGLEITDEEILDVASSFVYDWEHDLITKYSDFTEVAEGITGLLYGDLEQALSDNTDFDISIV